MKIVLCGGGTAGHVNPAIAIGQLLKQNDKNCKLLFIGRENGAENTLAKELRCKIKTIRVEGLRPGINIKNIPVLFHALKAKRRARKILLEFNPDLVIGTGGYVCWPIITAAKDLGYKTAIHESNSFPGRVSRMLSRTCDLMMLGDESALNYLRRKDNALVTGNPLRLEFKQTEKATARRTLGLSDEDIFVVSFAGSLGAQRLNEVILQLFADKHYQRTNIKHIHACGKGHYQEFMSEIKHLTTLPSHIKALPYIENMPIVLSAADIAITRSGAMTLAELEATKTPAILIPSPYVAENHQYKNAEHARDKGYAEIISESELSKVRLMERILTMASSEKLRKTMSDCCKQDSELTHNKILNAIKELISN